MGQFKAVSRSPEEREKYLNEKLRYIIKHAYENAPAAKKKMDAVGVKPSDIRTTKDIEKLPVTTKDELRDLQKENPIFGGFVAVPEEQLKTMFISPGPLYDAGNVDYRGQTIAIALSRFNVGKGDRVVNTFSYHMMPLGHWFHQAVLLMGATIIPTGTGGSEAQARTLYELGVTGYIGTASFLDTILKKAEGQGLDIRRDLKLRWGLFIAEMFPLSLRKHFEEDYGIETMDSWGTADLGVIAYDCEHKAGMHFTDEGGFIEIVDPKTGKQLGPGEVGEVVVTNFDEVYPLIRFGTGDLSKYADEPCACGRFTPRLQGMLGRVGEAIKIRGTFVHPKQVGEVCAKFPVVTKYQLVLDRAGQKDVVTLQIETKEEVADKEKLFQDILKCFPDVCTVKANSVKIMPPGTIPEERKIILDQRVWE